jgi:uncharacterized membrane protein YozB (DUF420 family)
MSSAVGGQDMDRNFVRSVVVLTVCIFATAALLLPVAIREQGTGNLAGLAFVTAMFLASSWISEAASLRLHRSGSALAAMGLSMAIRTVPPLLFCFYLAARGYHGRENFALIGYLFAFYFVTLVVETRLAVKRSSGPNSN